MLLLLASIVQKNESRAISHQSVDTLMFHSLLICHQPVSIGDIFHICILVLCESERFCKVKANNGILLLPAKHSAPGSLKECHWVIAISIHCQPDSSVLEVSVTMTHHGLPGERVVAHT